MESFSRNWFTLYYLSLGMIFLIGGVSMLLNTLKVRDYLFQAANHRHPPDLLRNILKYFFLFTLPCIVLSFVPFSWIELLFSLWSLLMVFILGLQLVRWEQSRKLIRSHPERMELYIRITSALLVALSFVMVTLSYLAAGKMAWF